MSKTIETFKLGQSADELINSLSKVGNTLVNDAALVTQGHMRNNFESTDLGKGTRLLYIPTSLTLSKLGNNIIKYEKSYLKDTFRGDDNIQLAAKKFKIEETIFDSPNRCKKAYDNVAINTFESNYTFKRKDFLEKVENDSLKPFFNKRNMINEQNIATFERIFYQLQPKDTLSFDEHISIKRAEMFLEEKKQLGTITAKDESLLKDIQLYNQNNNLKVNIEGKHIVGEKFKENSLKPMSRKQKLAIKKIFENLDNKDAAGTVALLESLEKGGKLKNVKDSSTLRQVAQVLQRTIVKTDLGSASILLYKTAKLAKPIAKVAKKTVNTTDKIVLHTLKKTGDKKRKEEVYKKTLELKKVQDKHNLKPTTRTKKELKDAKKQLSETVTKQTKYEKIQARRKKRKKLKNEKKEKFEKMLLSTAPGKRFAKISTKVKNFRSNIASSRIGRIFSKILTPAKKLISLIFGFKKYIILGLGAFVLISVLIGFIGEAVSAVSFDSMNSSNDSENSELENTYFISNLVGYAEDMYAQLLKSNGISNWVDVTVKDTQGRQYDNINAGNNIKELVATAYSYINDIPDRTDSEARKAMEQIIKQYFEATNSYNKETGVLTVTHVYIPENSIKNHYAEFPYEDVEEKYYEEEEYFYIIRKNTTDELDEARKAITRHKFDGWNITTTEMVRHYLTLDWEELYGVKINISDRKLTILSSETIKGGLKETFGANAPYSLTKYGTLLNGYDSDGRPRYKFNNIGKYRYYTVKAGLEAVGLIPYQNHQSTSYMTNKVENNITKATLSKSKLASKGYGSEMYDIYNSYLKYIKNNNNKFTDFSSYNKLCTAYERKIYTQIDNIIEEAKNNYGNSLYANGYYPYTLSLDSTSSEMKNYINIIKEKNKEIGSAWNYEYASDYELLAAIYKLGNEEPSDINDMCNYSITVASSSCMAQSVINMMSKGYISTSDDDFKQLIVANQMLGGSYNSTSKIIKINGENFSVLNVNQLYKIYNKVINTYAVNTDIVKYNNYGDIIAAFYNVGYSQNAAKKYQERGNSTRMDDYIKTFEKAISKFDSTSAEELFKIIKLYDKCEKYVYSILPNEYYYDTEKTLMFNDACYLTSYYLNPDMNTEKASFVWDKSWFSIFGLTPTDYELCEELVFNYYLETYVKHYYPKGYVDYGIYVVARNFSANENPFPEEKGEKVKWTDYLENKVKGCSYDIYVSNKCYSKEAEKIYHFDNRTYIPFDCEENYFGALRDTQGRNNFPSVCGNLGNCYRGLDCIGFTLYAPLTGSAYLNELEGLPIMDMVCGCVDDYGMLPITDVSVLQPGDLLSYGSFAEHYGIYMGYYNGVPMSIDCNDGADCVQWHPLSESNFTRYVPLDSVLTHYNINPNGYTNYNPSAYTNAVDYELQDILY